MKRALVMMVVILGSVVLESCGPTNDPTPDTIAEAHEAQTAEELAAEPVEVGPVEPEPGAQEADLRVKPERLVTREEAERAESEDQRRAGASNRLDPKPTSGNGLWRADGRPVWWVDHAGWRDGRYSLSAEALGDDVRSARRAAIDAARRDAESALGGSIREERVESALVRAISADATGKARFVGYVKMSALRGE